MSATTYTADDYVRTPDRAPETPGAVRFVIEAGADPDALLKVATGLNFANKCPSRLLLTEQSADYVEITAVLIGIYPSLAEFIRRKLLQLTCVIDVQLHYEA